MICSAEEVLLLLQKWATDSASVRLLLRVKGADGASRVALSLAARVVSVDTAWPGFSLSMGEEANSILVHLDGWSLGFAAEHELPADLDIEQSISMNLLGVDLHVYAPLTMDKPFLPGEA